MWKGFLKSLAAAGGLFALLTLVHQVWFSGPEPSTTPEAPALTESTAPLTPSVTDRSETPPSPSVTDRSETPPSPSVTDRSETPPSPSVTDESNQKITEARIEVDEDYLIKPNTVSSGESPGFEPFIFTATGRLSSYDPCYVNWKLYNNSKLVIQEDTGCEKEGFASVFWPLDIELKPGTVKVSADITTGWGATKTAEIDLKVK